ncbi:caspase-3-like [Oppia nitens]|uniref:caspase-3-like n=1 Tax=Oppia nitens TaxID=1686743 RepID=UPI0023DCBD8B|nr:caspase-3-like [Oppia nitens]
MDSKEQEANSSDSQEVVNNDEKDANTWFNFGNRQPEQGSEFAVLNIHEDSLDYDTTHKNFGKCLILNHEFFVDNRCPQRKGSTADANSLFQCFSSIGFDVKMKTDLNSEQIFQYISSVAKEDHSDNDCFICCILTHGYNDLLWAYDQMYSLDTILSFFTGDNCLSLAGKPKIFIIQACRGIEYDNGVSIRVPTVGRDVCDSGCFNKTVKIPVYADFLIAYSSMSGFYSWRNQLDGSWFVSHLTDIIKRYHPMCDLLSMLTIINQRIAYKCASRCADNRFNDKKQVSCVSHTLTRRIFFSPKDVVQTSL